MASLLNHILRLMPGAAVLTLSFSACAGNGADEAVTPEPTTSASEYVRDVCGAAGRMFATYQKTFNDNRESLGGMDPTDAYARTARQPFATLISELEGLTPPTEAAAGHEQTIRQAKEVLEALRAGDRQKLLSLRGTPDTGTWKQVIDLAPDLKSRYHSASLEAESCRQLAKSGAGNPFQ